MNKEEKDQEKKELDAMFDALDSGVVKTDAPSTDPPDEVKTEPPSTDEPKTEPPTTEEPADVETDAPKTDAPTTDAPDEAAELKRENEELRKKVDEMSAPKTEAPVSAAPATDPPVEGQDFVGELDLDEVSRDPVEFNKLLNKVHAKAVTDTRLEFKSYNKSTLEKVPALVSDNVSVQNKLQALTTNFYKDNPDLKGFPKVVGVVFDELVIKNPKDPYDKVLEDVGVEVRSRLELKKKADKKVDNGNPSPPLPRKKGRRNRPAPEKGDPVTNEIGEMNESLNR